MRTSSERTDIAEGVGDPPFFPQKRLVSTATVEELWQCRSSADLR